MDYSRQIHERSNVLIELPSEDFYEIIELTLFVTNMVDAEAGLDKFAVACVPVNVKC